jgi:hypothetical protein
MLAVVQNHSAGRTFDDSVCSTLDEALEDDNDTRETAPSWDSQVHPSGRASLKQACQITKLAENQHGQAQSGLVSLKAPGPGHGACCGRQSTQGARVV